jgi:hypothetical protein
VKAEIATTFSEVELLKKEYGGMMGKVFHFLVVHHLMLNAPGIAI